MGSVGRVGLPVALMSLLLAGVPAQAQSQSDKTGVGSVAVAGQESTSILMHPLVVGTVVAAAIGVALAVSASDDSALVTVSTSTSTTPQ